MAARERSKTRFSSRTVIIPLISVTLLCILSASFFLSSVIYGMMTQDITCPPLLGNRPENLARLEGETGKLRPFSFLVVGDTKTSVAFEYFYNNIHLETSPDFGIIMGDFVAEPEVNRHRFFMREFSEWGIKYPILLIAGNHDIVTDNDIVSAHIEDLSDPFYPRDFEGTYGPTNFSFTHAGCLFIGLNDVYNGSYIDYAREVLSRKSEGSLMTFVFMHIPPQSLSPVVKGRGIAREEEFYRLIGEYGVDYVFSGDFHSYFRSDRNHTNYVVTGGGGSSLSGGSERSFYHVLLLVVDPEVRKVDEIIYPIGKTMDFGDDVEIVLLAQLYPLFEPHPLLWAALFTLIVLSGLTGMIWLLTMTAAGRSKKTVKGEK